MSMPVFQSALMRLITEPAFRDHVLAHGADPCPGLSPLEASRLSRIAADRGLDINRTLHKGFRLGKLRALLPFTCRLLGPKRLMREVSLFWQQQPPAGFSFLPEALDFCRFLGQRRLRVRYLDEVLAYERAALELERARIGDPPEQHVRFRHDAALLLSALLQGKRPRGLPLRPCRLTGRRSAHGRADWAIEYRASRD